MIGVALYGLVISGLLSAGGWLLERVLASLRGPRRGAWIAAMLLSVAIAAWRLPGALPNLSPVQVAAPRGARRPTETLAEHTRHAPVPTGTAAHAPRDAPVGAAERAAHRFWTAARYQRLLWGFLAGWSVVSGILLARLFAGAVTVRRRLRHGASTVLDGVPVLLTEALDPAVLGMRHPRIVVPRALAAQSPQRRATVLAHLTEHLRAHDGQVLLGAQLLILVMPWNLPLWWLRRRLRLAIEVDCDARVLRRGVAPAPYAAALLRMAARTAPGAPPAIGLIEQRTLLGRRLCILRNRPRPWWPWAALPLYALAGLAALAAGTFPAPPIDAALGARNQSRYYAQLSAAMRREDAQVTGRLLASRQPYALAAAALLGWPFPDGMRRTHGRDVLRKRPANAAQRLAWLARASAQRPDSVTLVLLEKRFCQLWHEHCGIEALDARLRTLDPRNGVGWLDALQTSVKANDARGIDAALGSIGRSRHVDVDATERFARLAEALHRIGGENFRTLTEQLQFMRGDEVPFQALFAFAQTCSPNNTALNARRLQNCRTAAVALERGDTLAVSALGSGIAMRLWPIGTPEHRRARRDARRTQQLSQHSAYLLWPRSGWERLLIVLDTAGYLERLDARIVHADAQHRREQDALRAELKAEGFRAADR